MYVPHTKRKRIVRSYDQKGEAEIDDDILQYLFGEKKESRVTFFQMAKHEIFSRRRLKHTTHVHCFNLEAHSGTEPEMFSMRTAFRTWGCEQNFLVHNNCNSR